MERRFQPVKVAEPTVSHTIEILKGLREMYENYHRVTITDQAVIAAANLSHRYIVDRNLPDKAIDLLDEAGAWRTVRRMHTTDEYKTVEAELTKVSELKQKAVEEQDFEEAGRYRDKEQELQQRLQEIGNSNAQTAAESKRRKDEQNAEATNEQSAQEEIYDQEEDEEETGGGVMLAERGEEDSSSEQDLEDFYTGSDEETESETSVEIGTKEPEKISRDLFEEIDEESIAEVLSMWTGIPVYKITEEETEKLLRMEGALHRRVIGQDEAVKATSLAIRRTRAGLKDPKRPSGSFIFLGPSGVGKTELAKTLAEFLFGDEKSMIALDMSEYQEKHSITRLVGSPPGYVGYDEGGQLTAAVRERPFSVVLFDEIEKAHPDIFNVLLQVLEEGRLTDSHGRTVDFRNTVIVMTSNEGTQDLRKASVGFTQDDSVVTYERMKHKVNEALKKKFRPEFINRIDDIVVFHELEQEEVRQIVDLMIKRLAVQLHQQGIGFELSHEAKTFLAEKGYDRELGARPLRRAIQRYVEDPMSERLLNKEFKAGEIVLVDVEDNPDKDSKDKQIIVFRSVEGEVPLEIVDEIVSLVN